MSEQTNASRKIQLWELDAFADGEASPAVAAYLADHPELWAAWQKQQRPHAALQAALHRFDCPEPDRLRQYYWAELTDLERTELDQHLQRCPVCRAELAEIHRFMAADGEPTASPAQDAGLLSTLIERAEELAEQMRLVVATLVTPAAPQLAGVALRSDAPDESGASPHLLLFEADGIDISLLIRPAERGNLHLSGQAFAATLDATWRFALTPADPQSAAVQGRLDGEGNFLVDQVAPGAYQLVLIGPELAVVAPNLVLRIP